MEAQPIDAGAILATAAVFAVVIRGVIQAIRRQWPFVDGLWVQVLALILGFAAAWVFDLQGAEALLEYVGAPAARVPHVLVDYLVTGGAIAATAGFFSDVAKNPDPVVVEIDENGEPL